MIGRELDAAGVAGAELRRSYEACRRLNASHGRTYYLATLLLPPDRRPAVYALYGFARYADEIVDDLASPLTVTQKSEWLHRWAERFQLGLGGGGAPSREAEGGDVLPAVWDTVRRYDIAPQLFADFLASMVSDLSVTEYATYADLMTYVHGSAVVIGLEMLPVLGCVVPFGVAAPYACDLAAGFQIANFIRDVGEDLRRDRIYLPMEDLAAFGVDRERLARGVVDGPVRRLLAFEIARARELFRTAAAGIRLLHPEARPCVEVAWRLYGGILDAVEAADYRVLDRRARVGLGRRVAVAAPGLARAALVRRAGTRGASGGRPAPG